MLQLWSEERNLVRTVTALQVRRDVLRIEVRRFGQTRPQVLRLVPDLDQRTPSVRDTTRKQFLPLLARALQRAFPDLKPGDTFASADLEKSFGPAYVRLTLERAQTVWAVVAINGSETQASVDGVLTVAVLWLHQCRERAGGRKLVEGVRVIVPEGTEATTRERLHWLRTELAKWELWTLDERREELSLVPPAEFGNIRSFFVSAFNRDAALARMQTGTDQVLAFLTPEQRARTEIVPRSGTEISFRLHGLEFARVRHSVAETSFRSEDRITFGAGGSETPLDAETEPLLRYLVERLFQNRHPGGSAQNPLFRLQPERWLESVLLPDLPDLEPAILPSPIYPQVPALHGGDRGLLDLLAVTREGRLAVLELKASEDLHMPFQGLDYWMRVRRLHADGAFSAGGYFPGIELAPGPPILYFILPSLRVHSTVDTLLRAFSPDVEWRLLALEERWRLRRAVVFRKSGGARRA